MTLSVVLAMALAVIAASMAGQDYRLRALSLGFLAIYVLSIPVLLVTQHWYLDCIVIELFVLIIGVCAFHSASIALIKLSILNIILNLLAWNEPYEGQWTSMYRDLVPWFEVLQGVLLVLYTPPVCRWIASQWAWLRNKTAKRNPEKWTAKLSNFG